MMSPSNEANQMVHALEFIEVGRNEDGEPVILLTGSEEAVRTAGKIFGLRVALVPAVQEDGAA